MKTLRRGLRFCLPVLAVCLCAATVFALTYNNDVNAAYVREHPKEFSVDVKKGDDGLIHFKIVHSVETPKYHVAHLSIYHQGKLIAESSTPAFGHKNGNTFHFSIAAENIADAKFELSDSVVGGEGENAVPLPGTVNHRFNLLDFVPDNLKPAKP